MRKRSLSDGRSGYAGSRALNSADIRRVSHREFFVAEDMMNAFDAKQPWRFQLPAIPHAD
jgi:hypothetical protein